MSVDKLYLRFVVGDQQFIISNLGSELTNGLNGSSDVIGGDLDSSFEIRDGGLTIDSPLIL